jgi:hypothetical protein
MWEFLPVVKLMTELSAAAVIVPCDEPIEYTSPAHFARMPGTDKVRPVTDYWQLNRVFKRPMHPFMAAPDLIR